MKRVFISYSHDTDVHKERISALADRLRSDLATDNIGLVLDRDMLPGGPAEGWPEWCERQVVEADVVLVACSPAYHDSYNRQVPVTARLGTTLEIGTIRQYLYEHKGINAKVRAVLLDAEDGRYIPDQLKPYQAFDVSTGLGYQELLDWIRGPGSKPTSPTAPITGTVRWPIGPPNYEWPLADRTEEFALFRSVITAGADSLHDKRILLWQGASSTGKTALLYELLAFARTLGIPSAFLDFKGCPAVDEVYEAISLDLEPWFGRQTTVNGRGTARGYQLISILQQRVEPILLVFDTYEKASADSRTWLETQLLPRLDRAPGVVVLLGGQEVPDVKHGWRGLVDRRQLDSIEGVEHWVEYTQKRWKSPVVNREHVLALTLATRGNPGVLSALLETMVRGLRPAAQSNERT